MRRFKSAKTKKGRKVRSKLEAKVLDQLDKEKIEYEYEQSRLEWFDTITGARCLDCGSKRLTKRRMYLPDLVFRNGTIIEVKGKFTARDRRLAEGIKRQYPNLDFRLVFDRDNKLAKSSTTRYSGWCKSREIPCVFKGTIPESWIKELK